MSSQLYRRRVITCRPRNYQIFIQFWSWGDNSPTRTKTPEAVFSRQNYKVKQVAAGNRFVCFLTTDGDVFTWGRKDLVGHGDLGSDIQVPRKLEIEKICQIACGLCHTLLLSADQKTVWAFGYNQLGQLGRNTELGIHETTPVKVEFLGEKVIHKLKCGATNSAVLSADGKITMWGNLIGVDGEPRFENPHEPRIIDIQQKVVDISLGGNFVLALTVNNRLYAFGNNSSGQCGQEERSDFIEEPVEVRGLAGLRIKEISAGDFHCLVKCARI